MLIGTGYLLPTISEPFDGKFPVDGHLRIQSMHHLELVLVPQYSLMIKIHPQTCIGRIKLIGLLDGALIRLIERFEDLASQGDALRNLQFVDDFLGK